jgi:hypothetical protein
MTDATAPAPGSAGPPRSRTIPSMQPVPEDAIVARRELLLAGVLLVVLARAVDGPAAWGMVALVLVAALLAVAAIAGLDRGLPAIHAAIVPAVLVAGAAAVVRLVPVGLGLVVAIAAVAVLLDRVVRLELRLLRQPAGPTPGDRSRVLLAVVVTGFVAFAGVAALVPGGLAEPASNGAPTPPIAEAWLAALGAHLRDPDRDRRQRRPRHRPPAAGRSRAARARPLPVGCRARDVACPPA